MKKHRVSIMGFITLLLIHHALAARTEITLKLTGGTGYLQTGEDWKTLFESTKSRWVATGYTGSYDLAFNYWLADANAEAVIHLFSSFSIGLGAGFLNKSWSQNTYLDYNWVGAGSIDYHNHFQVISIPLTIEAIGSFPLGQFTISIKAGTAYYFTRFKASFASEQSEPNRPGQPGWKWNRSHEYSSDWNGNVGYHGGISIDYQLKRGIFLTLDLIYRRVLLINKFRGTYDYEGHQSWTGGSEDESLHSDKAYAWFGRQDTPGQTWRFLEFADVKPPMFDCACPFGIDLTGVCMRIGLSIRL